MVKCPICQQQTDFIVVSCRNAPFIDDKCYPKICFGCFHVPVEWIQVYRKDGSLDHEEGPYWDHKHLHTAQELFEQGSCDTLKEARACVRGVKQAIKKAGIGRKKPKPKTKPKQVTEIVTK